MLLILQTGYACAKHGTSYRVRFILLPLLFIVAGMLKEKDLEQAVVCVLANKCDLPNALPIGEITNLLELPSLPKER